MDSGLPVMSERKDSLINIKASKTEYNDSMGDSSPLAAFGSLKQNNSSKGYNLEAEPLEIQRKASEEKKSIFHQLKRTAHTVAKRAQEHTRNGIRIATETLEFGKRATIERRKSVVFQSRPLFGAELKTAFSRQTEKSIFEHCISYLDKHVDEVGIYRISGSLSEVKKLQSQFDTDQKIDLDVSKPDPHAIASLFKLWFRSLPECCLTDKIRKEMVDIFLQFTNVSIQFPDYLTPNDDHPVCNNPKVVSKLFALVSKLPRENWILLSKFLPHLNRIAANHVKNKMGLRNLLVVWSPTLGFGSSLLVTLIVQCDYLFKEQINKQIDTVLEQEESQEVVPSVDSCLETCKESNNLKDNSETIKYDSVNRKTSFTESLDRNSSDVSDDLKLISTKKSQSSLPWQQLLTRESDAESNSLYSVIAISDVSGTGQLPTQVPETRDNWRLSLEFESFSSKFDLSEKQ